MSLLVVEAAAAVTYLSGISINLPGLSALAFAAGAAAALQHPLVELWLLSQLAVGSQTHAHHANLHIRLYWLTAVGASALLSQTLPVFCICCLWLCF
jgi:hypothetical protein